MDIRYRHEWKHEISPADLLAIRQRLRAVAVPDPHARGGKYMIRSLYFDSSSDKALREKTDGVNLREKFRIRYYNKDTSLFTWRRKASITVWGQNIMLFCLSVKHRRSLTAIPDGCSTPTSL